jgi:hypothetical protein
MDPLLQDLNERLNALFRRCPELHGFAVRLDRPIPCELTCYPPPQHGEQAEAALAEIAQMLSELLDERPEAASLLRGRTFARTLH